MSDSYKNIGEAVLSNLTVTNFVTWRRCLTSIEQGRKIVQEKAMENLSKRELELVALGASLGSNCVPCIAFHVSEAKKCGLAYQQIKQAIEIAAKIRNVPAALVRNTAFAHLEDASESSRPQPGLKNCDCGR